MEEVGARAQEILDESHVSSRLGCQATQLTSRYQALLLQVLVSRALSLIYISLYMQFCHQNILLSFTSTHLSSVLFPKEHIKFLEEEIQSLEESELSLSSYSDWFNSTHKNFKNVAVKIDKVDKVVMEKKLKTLEVGYRYQTIFQAPSLP